MIAATAVGAAAIGATLGLFFAANTRLKSANVDSARAAKVSAAVRTGTGTRNPIFGQTNQRRAT